MVTCKDCKKQKTCKDPCVFVEKYANQDYVSQHERLEHINFFEYTDKDYKKALIEVRNKKDEIRDSLIEQVKNIKDPKLKASLSLMFFGFSYRKISKLLAIPRTTIQYWIRIFK